VTHQIDLNVLAAQAGFSGLSKAEKELLPTAPTEDDTVCGPNNRLTDRANNPRSDDEWGADRSIGAGLIRWLCTQAKVKALVDPTGISIIGATISGRLSLAFLTVPFPLRFVNCRLPDGINTPNAH